MRVLIGAYAFAPISEPEAAAGWGFATAAAQRHEVWVVTRQRFEPQVTRALAADPDLAARMHVTYIDYPEPLLKLKQAMPGSVYWYYPMWQRLLGNTARRLHAQHQFDVAHHVSWANDWMPCGLTQLDEVPLVWGPVGGASRTPAWRLRTWLGARGLLTEWVRDTAVASLRRAWGDPVARRAALVVAQNGEVATRFAGSGQVVTEANAIVEAAPTQPNLEDPPTAVFVGRLIPWKGPLLALDALAHPAAAGWRMDFYGDGPLRARLKEQAARLGVSDRVRFRGHRPRGEVLHAVATADAMLFPSMHDQAGWVAAEASAAGTPVVCLPLGGPPLLAGENAHVASLEGDAARNLAERMVYAQRGLPSARWSAARLPDLLDSWYAKARATRRPPVEVSE